MVLDLEQIEFHIPSLLENYSMVLLLLWVYPPELVRRLRRYQLVTILKDIFHEDVP
jgi:hypothetical protein